ncbi:MAG: F0F1 ATP synthase subunit delta [Candidatus Nomurabacteria bacterium]
MASISIKNLAHAIYDSSLDKEGIELNSIVEKSVIFIRDKNLLGKKKEILEELENIINKKNGIIKARVSSSEKLKEESKKEVEDFIKKKYKANEVIMEQETNPKLLGGIKIEIGDDIIDTTLSNKIHQLKNYLNKN